MLLTEYQDNLRKLADVTTQRALDSVVVPAANELLAKIKARISQAGKNSKDQSIGQYSTKPAYFNKEQFIQRSKFRNVGKTGKATKSTMYIPTGYKGLRDLQGRETSKKNFEYSGETLRAYQMQDTGRDVLLGLVTEKAAKIREGLENGTRRSVAHGKVFYATQKEIDDYNDTVVEESKELTLTILKNV